jgi:hypothetical protein
LGFGGGGACGLSSRLLRGGRGRRVGAFSPFFLVCPPLTRQADERLVGAERTCEVSALFCGLRRIACRRLLGHIGSHELHCGFEGARVAGTQASSEGGR